MVLIVLSCLLLTALAAASAKTITAWTENFAGGHLDPNRWQLTTDGDFREWDVSVAGVPAGAGAFRLGLSADTQGTRDDTVKFVGVRSISPIRLDGEVRVSVDLDWNKQSNGSYLSAAVVLSPYATSESPLKLADWFKVEYVGVPPGTNARMVIGLKSGGQERTLHNEGWPETNRAGRTIGLQHLVIVFHDQNVQVRENDQLVYDSKQRVADFNSAFLYLQMSSHSNYPRRTIYFGDIRVEEERNP
jgi:hypothetical protein